MPRKKKNRPAIPPVVLGVAIAFLLLAGWGFWNQFQKLEEIGKYKACLEIENDPSLAFPCTCRPKALNATEGFEYIYQKSEPLCICECKISENETKIFEVRKASNQDTSTLRVPEVYS